MFLSHKRGIICFALGMAVLVMASQAKAVVTLPNPVAEYHCEDVLPGPIQDSTPLPTPAYDGIIAGGTIASTDEGKFNKGLDLQGGYFYMNTGPLSSGLAGMTVAGWVKADTIGYMGIFDISGGLKLSMQNSTLRAFAGTVAGYPDTGISATATKNLADGQWHHLAVVYDKNARNQALKLYIDGQVAGIGNTGTYSPLVAHTSYSYIGKKYLDMSIVKNFDGKMDELMIWNQALSADQIGAAMTVPEPCTLGLLGCGIAGLMARRKR